MATETREVMTVEQVADYLQVEQETVRRLIEERELPAFEVVEGEWRIDRQALRRWIDRRIAEHSGDQASSRAMSNEDIRKLREDIAADRARRPPLTREWLDRVRATREGILEERGGKPFSREWIREAIDWGRM
jgi:excisionase family DNA binding protein